MTDPRRLLDDESATSPALRSLLESAKHEDEPADGRVSGLTTRLAPLLAPLAPVPPPAAPAAAAVSTGKGALVAKIGAAVVAAGLAGGGAWVAYDRSRSSPHAPPRAVVQHTLPEAPPPPPAPEVAPETPRTPLALPEPNAPRPAQGDVEGTLVQAAQAALLRDQPAAALDLARQHAARYANGAHAEERDRIAIEALVRLGRGDEARAQAQRFFARYPRSIYRARIEALLR